MHTPGHSFGHLCLWSDSRGAVISGDHILPGVTPPVTFQRGFDPDPMRSYLASLQSIRTRRPALVLPGTAPPSEKQLSASMPSRATRSGGWTGSGGSLQEAPCTVGMLTDRLVGRGMASHQRELAVDELFAHVVYLRHSDLIERRVRSDGLYEWFARRPSARRRGPDRELRDRPSPVGCRRARVRPGCLTRSAGCVAGPTPALPPGRRPAEPVGGQPR